MIKEFIDRYRIKHDWIKSKIAEKQPESYDFLVKLVVEAISDGPSADWYNLDPERIHIIDDGNYQGTRLYVIANKGYQPSCYFYVFVNYGSCSGCDTFEAIRNYSDELPTEEQIKDYLTLCLHILQGIKLLGHTYENEALDKLEEMEAEK